MSVTIRISGKRATLARGKWRSGVPSLQQLLNNHLATLRVPGHYPPSTRELMTAEAAVRDLGAVIIDHNPQPTDASRMADGRPKVY